MRHCWRSRPASVEQPFQPPCWKFPHTDFHWEIVTSVCVIHFRFEWKIVPLRADYPDWMHFLLSSYSTLAQLQTLVFIDLLHTRAMYTSGGWAYASSLLPYSFWSLITTYSLHHPLVKSSCPDLRSLFATQMSMLFLTKFQINNVYKGDNTFRKKNARQYTKL